MDRFKGWNRLDALDGLPGHSPGEPPRSADRNEEPLRLDADALPRAVPHAAFTQGRSFEQLRGAAGTSRDVAKRATPLADLAGRLQALVNPCRRKPAQ